MRHRRVRQIFILSLLLGLRYQIEHLGGGAESCAPCSWQVNGSTGLLSAALFESSSSHRCSQTLGDVHDIISFQSSFSHLTAQDFLNGVCTHIIWLTKKKLTYYTGNYDTFRKTVRENEVIQMKKYHKEQDDIKHLKEFIASCGTYSNLVKQACLLPSRCMSAKHRTCKAAL